MDRKSFEETVARVRAARTLTMAGGKYPISDQHSANSAWKLRNNGKGVTEEQVVAHIRAACRALGLHFPGEDSDGAKDSEGPKDAKDAKDRQAAATMSQMQAGMRAHGFVYPAGMPPCSQCGMDPNLGAHVNPAHTGGILNPAERRIVSADQVKHRRLHRSHAYSTGYLGFHASVPCQACGNTMSAACHSPGLPVGTGGGATATSAGTMQMASSREIPRQAALVTTVVLADGTERTILSAPASIVPNEFRELADSSANPHFLWVEGAYVEADMPNRNAAMWSTKDLELGVPTVAHGPLNWLHEERHVIGSIAAAKLVRPEVQQAAEGGRAHIRTMSAIWSYLYPGEARQVAQASDERKLWHSMECVSREVACASPECTHAMSYSDYMRKKEDRCDHMKGFGPRRFADPQFLGGAVILNGVRPGWDGASAQVMRRQAASALEGQEQAVTGLSEAEAVDMVAQIISYASGGTQ